MGVTVRDILLRFTGDQSGADAAIDDVAAHLKALDGTTAEADVKLAHDAFEAEVARVNAELDRLGARKVTAKVRLKLDDSRADLERVAQDAGLAFDRYFHAQGRGSGGMFSGLIRDAVRLASDLSPVSRALTSTTADVEQLSDASTKGSGFMATFGDKISQIQPIAGGLFVVLALSLIPAIVAVGSSALAAVAGVAALGVAFVGTLLPAIAPVAAAFLSITRVIKVLLERSNAQKQAAADVGLAHQKAAQKMMAEHAAAVAIRNAREALAAAERNYAQAVIAAAKQIADARRTEKKAESDLGETRHNARIQEANAHRRTIAAAKQLKSVTKDAYQAWADAVQNATDATLGLEDAQIGLLDAEDRLYTSQIAFNALLAQLPSDKIGDILKKFKDVNVPEAQVVSYVMSVGGTSESDAHKLYRAWLDLVKAQQGVKDATNAVHKATVANNKAQADAAEFAKKGVKAYGPYNDAVARLAQAKRDEKETTHNANRAIAQAEDVLKRAKKTLAEYVKEGVHGMPQVRNAADQVRSATQHLADAQWNAKHRADQLTTSLGKQSSTARRAAADWAALTPAQRALGNAITGISKALKTSGLGDLIVKGLATGIRAVSGLIKTIGPELKGLAGGMGDAIGKIAKAATGPGAVAFFRAMAIAATQLVKVGPKILIDFAKGLANVATAATPALARVLAGVADAMARFAKWSGTPAGQRSIQRMIDATFTWGKAIGQALGFFSRLIGLATPFGNELVKAFGKWMDGLFRTKKGQDDVKSFFKDTIPFVKSLFSLVGKVGTALIQVFQFLAPILKPFIDTAGMIVGWIGDIVGFLNHLIPAPVRAIVGDLVTLMLAGPKLLRYLGEIPGIIGKIATWVAKLGIVQTILNALGAGVNLIGKAAEAIGKAIIGAIDTAASTAWDLGTKLATWVGNAVKDAATWVAGVGGDIAKGIFDGLGDAAKFGAKIFTWIAGGIAAAVGGAIDVGTTIAKWIGGGLVAIAGWGITILNGIAHAIAAAAKGGVKGVASAGGAIAGWILSGIKDAASLGGKVLSWIAGAISKAAGGAASGLKSIGNWILKGIKAFGALGFRVIDWISTGIQNAAKGIWGVLKGVGTTIANKVWDGIKVIGHWVTDLFSGIWNGIKNGFNSLVAFITGSGGLKEVTGITSWHWGPPKHAAGGIATRATLGIIGEEPGVSEAIIPLKPGILAQIGAGMAHAMAMQGGAPAVAFAAMPPDAARAADRGGAAGIRELHHHVHGKTERVDPDARTSIALLDKALRDMGGGRG